MARTVDHLADSDSLLASRDPELTARFIKDALPYLNQLDDRARRLTRKAVDAEDLMQETMLRAYADFNTPLRGNQPSGVAVSHHDQHLHQRSAPRATLPKRVPRPPDHRPETSRPGSTPLARATLTKLDAVAALPDIDLDDAWVTLSVQCRPAVRDLDTAVLRCREIAEILARCEGTVMSGRRAPTITNPVAYYRRSDLSINATATTRSRRRCRFHPSGGGFGRRHRCSSLNWSSS